MKWLNASLLAALAIFMTAPSQALERETGGFAHNFVVEVTFISPGNGIDFETRDEVLSVVQRGQSEGWLTNLMTTSLGFEGEVRYCLEINHNYTGRIANELRAIVDRGNSRQRLPKTQVEMRFQCTK